MKIFTITKSDTGNVDWNEVRGWNRLRPHLQERLFQPQAEGTLGGHGGQRFVSCVVADLGFMQIALMTFQGPNYEVGQCETVLGESRTLCDGPYKRLHRGIDQHAASEIWLLQIENYFPQGG